MPSYVLDIYKRFPVKIERAKSVFIYDESKKRYLDFTSGIATVNLGHCNEYIAEKLKCQIDKLWHCSNVFFNETQEEVAKRICDLTFADKVFFCSSGLEAVEAAIKFIRRYFWHSGKPHKNRIITLKNGFHGRSITGISAGGSKFAKQGFAPLLQGFDTAFPNDIESIKKVTTQDTAAIFLELVQSEGGVNTIDKRYLEQLKNIAKENGALLCLDEVQTGFGRMGKNIFHYQNLEIEPDILVCAKGMGNGFPIGACLLKNFVAQNIAQGAHGGTYGGNPLAMTVCSAVLDLLQDTSVLHNSYVLGKRLKDLLSELKKKFPSSVKKIKGDGMLLGIEFFDHINTFQILLDCLKRGLAITKTSNPQVIRILPPLISTEENIKDAVDIIEEVIKRL